MQIASHVVHKYPALKEHCDIYSNRKAKHVFWEDQVAHSLSIVDAAPNKLIWEFTVEEIHCNQLGNLHGGCVATIIDICSSFAILVHEGKAKWSLIGVSTDLSVSYMRGVPEGVTIRLECEVQRVGKTLANIYTKVYDDHGNICYSGSHSKYCIDSRL
ncbi:HotDog domain-containing protein [Radiomyces spectabilis]|uniref:HotDog domain-containing protein n=1 Tax=Radiomyces spectabilis TaxID=64574 RepID=UPI002220D240|nr:HotDog domain-containing protein [Radiomyces spectabilis]KAI8370320.1 HotDog domain-containing protein [Radiomyces spectabilis]